MYTSPSVLQCARTVTVGLFRKTGWPDRAWWSRSSTTTTTTSLTNFTSLGVIRPDNRGEIVSVYNLQWVARIPPGRLQSLFLPAHGEPVEPSVASMGILRQAQDEQKPIGDVTLQSSCESPQDDCKVFFYPLMVSLSNHRWLVWALRQAQDEQKPIGAIVLELREGECHDAR